VLDKSTVEEPRCPGRYKRR